MTRQIPPNFGKWEFLTLRVERWEAIGIALTPINEAVGNNDRCSLQKRLSPNHYTLDYLSHVEGRVNLRSFQSSILPLTTPLHRITRYYPQNPMRLPRKLCLTRLPGQTIIDIFLK